MTRLTTEWLGFYRRTMLEVFDGQGYEGETWHSDAREFIELMIPWVSNATILSRLPGNSLQANPGLRAKAAGCKDPLFLYLDAVYAERTELGRTAARSKRFEDAIEALAGSPYGPHLRAMALRELLIVRKDDADGAFRETYVPQVIDAWAAVVRGGVYPADQQRLLFWELRRVVERALVEDEPGRFAEAIESIPGVDPWIRDMVEGRSEILLGWWARTGRDVRDVDRNQLRGFAEHLNEAASALRRAWRQHPDRPEAAEFMVHVINGLGPRRPRGETERLWFDRAVDAQFDWHYAYDAYTWSTMPRWGGSADALLAFGKECADTGWFDTRVPMMLIEAQVRIAEDGGGLPMLEDDALYRRTMSVIDKLLETPEDSRKHDVLRSLGVAFAVFMNDVDRAGVHLESVGDRFSLGPYGRRLRVRDEPLLGHARVITSPLAELILRGDDHALQGEFDKALALYKEAGADERAQAASKEIDNRIASAAMLAAFHRGEWVEPTFARGYAGWDLREGHWRDPPNKGTMSFDATKDGLLAISWAPPGVRMEVEGEFDFSRMRYGNKTNVGIVIGSIDEYEKPDWQAVLFYRGEKEVVVRTRWDEGERRPAPIEPQFRFRIVTWDDDLAVFIEDELVFQGKRPLGDEPFTPAIGVCGKYWYDNGNATLSNLRFRRLSEKPEEIR